MDSIQQHMRLALPEGLVRLVRAFIDSQHEIAKVLLNQIGIEYQ